MSSLPAVEGFSSTTLVVLVSDVAGYARVFRTRSGAEVAAFLDRLYRASERTIAERGGRIIKFMGDAVLAVFPPRDVRNAVAAAVTLEALVPRLAEELELALEIGASIHMGSVVEAELGEGAGRRTDVIGRTVNQTFLMGRGPGIRISEPVYRKLPSSDRSPWQKNKPPVRSEPMKTPTGCERVSLITVEDDDDLIVAYAVALEEPGSVASLILQRTPKYEFLLPPEEHGVAVSHELDPLAEHEFAVRVVVDGSEVEIATAARRRLLPRGLRARTAPLAGTPAHSAAARPRPLLCPTALRSPSPPRYRWQ